MTYPNGLFKSIARDILNTKQSPYNSFSKQANVLEDRQRFLEQYGLNEEMFTQDPIVRKQVTDRQKALEGQIKSFYGQQAATSGLTPEMKQSQQKMLQDLKTQANTATQIGSIDRTRNVASENPKDFEQMLQLSRTSRDNLKESHGRELGMVGGGLAGLAGGFALGSALPRKNKGILQKGIGSGLGWLGGMQAGKVVGENYDERKTGYNHEDMLSPYQIADRIQTRKG